MTNEADRLEALLDEMLNHPNLYLREDIEDMHAQFNTAVLQEAIDEDILAGLMQTIQADYNEQA